MRIFYAAPTSPNFDGLPSSRLWQDNLLETLRDMGHDVVVFDRDLSGFFAHAEEPDWYEPRRGQLEEELLAAVRGAHRSAPIDLFFSYFYSSCVTPPTVREIRRLGFPTVNFSCNNIHQFDLVKELAPAYDFCMVPERATLERFREAGATPLYIQMAANPRIYRPYPLEREFQVTFVGQRYADRPLYIARLAQAGIDVRAFGPGWMRPSLGRTLMDPSRRSEAVGFYRSLSAGELVRRAARRLGRALGTRDGSVEAILRGRVGPPLDDEDLVRMYSRSQVSLGFSTVGESHRDDRPLQQVRLRDFEAPMSGALYCTGHMDELAEFFEPGREILTYRDADELVETVRHTLDHPAEAETIRLAGHRRARQDHTWEQRFRTLFREVGVAHGAAARHGS